MVRRFGSGAGSLQATERGRVFRGAPVQRPQGTPRDIAGEQRQAIQERLNNLNSQLQNLLRQQQENRIDGGSIRSRTLARKLQVQISGLSAEIQFLEQAKSSLQEGQAFQDITQVTELSQRANEEARRDVRRRQQNIKTPQEREEYARARQKPQAEFQELGEGYFYSNGKFFNPEGKEVFAQSRADGTVLIDNKPVTVKQLSNKPSTVLDYLNLQSKLPPQKTFYERFTGKPTFQTIPEAFKSGDIVVSPLTKGIYKLLKPQDTSLFAISTNIVAEKTPVTSAIVKGPIESPVSTAGLFFAFEFLAQNYAYTFSKQILKAQKISTTGISLRNVRVPTSTEFSINKILKDGTLQKESYFKIISETSPPKLKGNARIGLIETIKVSEPIVKITEPLGGKVINNQAYTSITYRVGGKTVKVQEVAGTSKILTPQDLQTLGKVESYTLKNLIETTGAGVVKVKGTKQLINTGELFLGEINTYKLYEANIKLKNIKFYGDTGTRTQKLLTISEIRPTIETPKLEVFSTETFYKDISKPFYRATGKTPQLKGELYSFKEPFFEGGTSFEPINLGKVGQDSFSSLSLKNLQVRLVNKPALPKQENLITIKQINKPSLIKETKTISPVVSKQKEVTLKTNLGFKEIKLDTQQININQRKEILIKDISLKLEQKGIQKLQPKEEIKLQPKLEPKLEIKVIEKLQPKLQPKLELKLNQRQLQKQIQKTSPRISTPETTQPPQGKKPFLIPFKLPKPSTTTRGLGLFSVQVRRRGKFRTVGLAETQEKAFEIGRNIVSKTLGATFKVSGKGVSIKTPKGFYTKKDKKEGVLLIEQPKYRLSTVTEISEIQRSRKRRK